MEQMFPLKKQHHAIKWNLRVNLPVHYQSVWMCN